MQAIFIDFSNFALNFLFSDFSQLDSSISCVTFACKLVFLSSKLKNWLNFLMKRFVSPFLFICQFIFSIFSVFSCFYLFLPFEIVSSWALSFIGALKVSLLLASLSLKNRFFCAINKLAHN